MKAVVVGLGSMGKRRIRLIREMFPETQISGVDMSPERRDAARETYGICAYASLAQALAAGPDCAFVCTSPLSHASITMACLEGGAHVFSELNLVDTAYEDAISLAARTGKVLFLSSTFLYRRETQYICTRTRKSGAPLSYLYHVGQYLPDWHPWEDYRAYFVGDKRSSGCREILAIELPWLITAFGNVVKANVRGGKNSSLDIAYDDSLLIETEHERGAKGVLAVDVVSRKAVRRLEVFGEEMYLTWDGTPDSLNDFDIAEKKDRYIKLFDDAQHQDNYAAFVIENPYRDEIFAFFRQIETPETPCAWDFSRDGQMLKLIDRMGV